MHETPFNPIINNWFISSYANPTDIQIKAWNSISKNNHSLLIAPTGSGKTFAAFLWALHQLIEGVWETGKTSILYVSPLKALNTDIRLNLLKPLFELNSIYKKLNKAFPVIRIATRSADTPQTERQQMKRHPPEIVITTPESLGIMLASKDYIPVLSTIKAVILDEIHYVLASKRGTYTIACLELLDHLSPGFQRIGMSATVSNPELAADFIGGFSFDTDIDTYTKRPVTIIKSDIDKKYEAIIDFDLKENKNDPFIYSDLISSLKKRILDKNSSIVFVNSRRMAEKIARLINIDENEPVAYAHHGSLSREYRFEVEQRLKKGHLKAIVATNSLELGIDIGDCEQVLMVETPFSVSSAMQRIGRAGHFVNEISKGYFYPIHPMDFFYTDCIIALIDRKEIEPLRCIINPLDVLSQIICLSLLLHPWKKNSLYKFIKTIYAYSTLPYDHFDNITEMLIGYHNNKRLSSLKPRIYIDTMTNTLYPMENLRFILYQSGGTIPDRGLYDLINAETKSKIGVLDEEFVWERKLHDTFAFGTNIWMITSLDSAHVEVTPVSKSPDIIPFWRAEELYRDFFLSCRFGKYLETLNYAIKNDSFKNHDYNSFQKNSIYNKNNNALSENDRSNKNTNTSKSSDFLQNKDQIFNTASLQNFSSLKNYKSMLEQQINQTGYLPGTSTIIVEYTRLYTDATHDFGKCTIIHSIFGNKINKPLSLLIEHYLLSSIKHDAKNTAKSNQEMAVSVNIKEKNVVKNNNHETKIQNSNKITIISTNNGILILHTHDVSLYDFFTSISVSNYTETLVEILSKTPLFGAQFRENSSRALLLPKSHWKKRVPLWWHRVRAQKLFEQIADFPEFPITIETYRSCLNDFFDMHNLKHVIDECILKNIQIHSAKTDHPSVFSKEILWNYTNIAMYEKDSLGTVQTSKSDMSLLKTLLLQKTKPFKLTEKTVEMYIKKLQRTLPDYIPSDHVAMAIFVKDRVLIPLSEWKSMISLFTDAVISKKNNTQNLVISENNTEKTALTDIFFKSLLVLYNSENKSIAILHKDTAQQLLYSFTPFISLYPYDDSVLNNDDTSVVISLLQEKYASYAAVHRINHNQNTDNKPSADSGITDLGVNTDIFTQWLSYYGPMTFTEVGTMLPFSKETTESLLSYALTDDTIIVGNLTLEETQICNRTHFYNLIKAEKYSKRSFFKPVDNSFFPLFLAHYQGLTKKSANEEETQSRIEQLFGYPADIEAWELYILPSRIESYHTSILEVLMQKYELLWYGCGEKKISFSLKDRLYQNKTATPDDANNVSSLFPSSFGKYSFFELLHYTNKPADYVSSQLWKLVWNGIISNTTMEDIRKGFFTNFTDINYGKSEQNRFSVKPSYNSWVNTKPTHGYWYVLPKVEDLDSDIDTTDIVKQRIRQLLKRYGIIFRDLLISEQSIFAWSKIIDALRLMELSGEILGGYFIKGISGIQFCFPEVIHLFSELDFSSIYWINACDPACVFHLEVYKNLIPDFRRIPSTYIVMKGKTPVLILKKKGQELFFLTAASDKNLPDYLTVFDHLVYRNFDPVSAISVLAINNTSSLSSEYANALLEFGFEKGYKGLEFRGKIK